VKRLAALENFEIERFLGPVSLVAVWSIPAPHVNRGLESYMTRALTDRRNTVGLEAEASTQGTDRGRETGTSVARSSLR